MDAPLAVKLSVIDGGDIVQPTPQRPRADMPGNGLRDKPVSHLFRWASMSAFEQVRREEATTGSTTLKVMVTALCGRKLCCVCVCVCVCVCSCFLCFLQSDAAHLLQ